MGLLHSLQEHSYTQAVLASPGKSLLSALAIVCLVTRIITGTRSYIARNNNDGPTKTVNRISYWIPWVGSAISFARNIEGTISSDRDHTGDGIFSYRIGNSFYYVVNMPSIVQQIFAQRGNTLNKQNTLEWFMRTTFDDKGASKNEPEAFHGHHHGLSLMLKEDFIHEATGRTVKSLEVEAARLVTSAPWSSPDAPGKEMELWEEAGNVKFNTDGSFEADFFRLVVNFMGQIVIDNMWGKALIKNHPNLQQDMWDFDAGLHHLVTKLLTNVTAAGRRAVSARDRLNVAMQEWHEAVAAKQAGLAASEKWGDLSDTSAIMEQRVKIWTEHRASPVLQRTNDVAIIWGVNVNSNKNVFWMLLQIYSRRTLLSDIRDEIAPYVRVSRDGARTASGLPKLDIDVEGLTHNCPVIKAAFYETMRMHMSGLGIREVIRPVTLRESASDAEKFGKKRPQAYTIPAGATLVMSNGTMQMDQRIFAEPDKFIPERFIEEGPDGKPKVSMRNLNVFGGGLYKCKGRYFAEKEVLIFAASLLVMWDVAPVVGEDIVMPQMGIGGASRSPKEDIRVRLTRRYN
ncbi:cytochrome P450 [Melanomma pulvis-pyrius CBS 109.77]|uniref:Cytochrome P450 n=1 Tax=Melanomma pulvis-pyrius CBS 109.77 TaxID=1314802 RepID=A0A6A6XV27_9PLEO|nr:cytochrome P450 [Melanomma pulvis-pyrius CBS 109.77]